MFIMRVCALCICRFYEWKKDGSKRQPYYIHLKDGRPLVFAALYDTWRNLEGEIVYTFTILTTCSSSELQWLHDRMPVILGNKGSTDAWLNGSSSSEFNTMLKPYEDPDLVWYPVTPAMGKSSFDGPECIKEIHMKTEEKNLISKFFSKKRTDIELESDAQVKSSSKESAKTNPVKNLKEEPDTEGNTELQSGSQRDDNDSKLDVSSLLHRGAEKCGTKRDYLEFSGDSKPTTGNVEKLGKSLGKKGNLTNTGIKARLIYIQIMDIYTCKEIKEDLRVANDEMKAIKEEFSVFRIAFKAFLSNLIEDDFNGEQDANTVKDAKNDKA
ncbi:hypothetical protein HHK36_027181 [Tetracentron sinense]|uniref:Embryonic stem cell-specific 5-hydroxymethylcytosine-binding protein n=1 Tax=Tetracentron sinense TaxID=13715 RepID=A0A834YM75_TETSI|nr:hypothetical protein HHK36_027181 [Tetracentron sinense]